MSGRQNSKTNRWPQLLGLLMGACGGIALIRYDYLLPPFPVFPVSVAAGLLMSVAVHEAGHVAAGLLVEFRCVVLMIWPLLFRRGQTGWNVSRARGQQHVGYAGFAPRHDRNLRRRMAVMLAGGPVTSLVSGLAAALCALSAYGQSSPWIWGPLAVFGLVSILICLGSSIPSKSKSVLNDAAKFRMLLRGGPAADRDCRLALLIGASVSGVRPRDLDVGLLNAVSEPADGSSEELTAMAFRYSWAIDSGQVDLASEILKKILERRDQLQPRARPIWLCEAAWFEAVFHKDAAAARLWLDHPENSKSPPSTGARREAEAAVALLEGRVDDAIRAAQAALRELDRTYDLGGAIATREQLICILAEASRPTVLP